jgi:hypothetical protein
MRAAAFNDAMAAARNGSVKLVQAWLVTGHIDEIEQGDRCQGWTLLHAAAAADQKAVVEFLLSRSPSVNAITTHGQTALHLAALDSHEDICKMLLEASCNPLLRTSPKLGSRTARDTALLFDRRPLALLLEEAEMRFSCSSSPGGSSHSSSTSAAARSKTNSLNRLADFSKWATTDWAAVERDCDASLAVPLARLPPAPSRPSQPAAATEALSYPPTYSSDPDRLLSFRPPPEGGCKPNSSDGGCGPPLPLMHGGGDGGVCYTWGQTFKSATVVIQVGQCIRSKDVSVKFTCDSIHVSMPSNLPCAIAFRGAQRVFSAIYPDHCTWTLDGAGVLEILLAKQTPSFWRCVVVGHPVIDSTLCHGPHVLSQMDDDASRDQAIAAFSKMF